MTAPLIVLKATDLAYLIWAFVQNSLGLPW